MQEALTREPSAPIATTGSEEINRLTEAILARLWSNPLLRMKGEQALKQWISLAIVLFLHNDPCQAAKQFMDRLAEKQGIKILWIPIEESII